MDAINLMLTIGPWLALASTIALIVIAVQMFRIADRVCDALDALMTCSSCGARHSNPRASNCRKCGAVLSTTARINAPDDISSPGAFLYSTNRRAGR